MTKGDTVTLFLVGAHGEIGNKIVLIKEPGQLEAKPTVETYIRSNETTRESLRRESMALFGEGFAEKYNFAELVPFYVEDIHSSPENLSHIYFVGLIDERQCQSIELAKGYEIVWIRPGFTRLGRIPNWAVDVVMHPTDINAIDKLRHTKIFFQKLLI